LTFALRWPLSGPPTGRATVIYEIRVYEAADGKADAMKARFKNEVVKRFPGHGIELLGVFESATDASRLTYLTRFKSEEDRSQAWTAFGADPEWRAVKTASEVDGPLLKNQTVSVLSPAVAGLLLA
jgi:heme-degrading monooxygenase HmoA